MTSRNTISVLPSNYRVICTLSPTTSEVHVHLYQLQLCLHIQLQTPRRKKKKSDRQVSSEHEFYIVENPLTPTHAKGIFLSEWKRKSNQSDGRQNFQPPPTPILLIHTAFIILVPVR